MMAMMLKYAKPQTISVREKRMGWNVQSKECLLQKYYVLKKPLIEGDTYNTRWVYNHINMVIMLKWQKFLQLLNFVGVKICDFHIKRNFVIVLKFTEFKKFSTSSKISDPSTDLHTWYPMLQLHTS